MIQHSDAEHAHGSTVDAGAEDDYGDAGMMPRGSTGGEDPVTAKEWEVLGGTSGHVSYKDIGQGKLGDCYFLAVLAAIADMHPGTLEGMFEKGSLMDMERHHPVFTTRWNINGKPVRVAVNDMLPADNLGVPHFVQVKEGNYWVVILEKAWAKLFGSFKSLETGTPSEVFKAITQAPVYTFHPTDAVAAGTGEALWSKLLEAKDEKFPMVVGTPNKTIAIGIYPMHAYMVVDVLTSFSDGAYSGRAVVLYNPHGADKYAGSLSNKDKSDGKFHCTWDEFLASFNVIDIAHMKPDFVISDKTLSTTKIGGKTSAMVALEFTMDSALPFEVQFEWPSHRFLKGCAYVEPTFVMSVAKKDNPTDFVLGEKTSFGMTNARAHVTQGAGTYQVFLSAAFVNAPWLDDFVVNVYAEKKTVIEKSTDGTEPIDLFLKMQSRCRTISSPPTAAYGSGQYNLNMSEKVFGLPIFEAPGTAVPFTAWFPKRVIWKDAVTAEQTGDNTWKFGATVQGIKEGQVYPLSADGQACMQNSLIEADLPSLPAKIIKAPTLIQIGSTEMQKIAGKHRMQMDASNPKEGNCLSSLTRLSALDRGSEIEQSGTDAEFPEALSSIGEVTDTCGESTDGSAVKCSEYDTRWSIGNMMDK
jgi:hypothetical protein